MFDKIFDVLLGSFSQQLNANPKLFWLGVLFLGAAMGTIFGFMQIVKVILRALRKKDSHGIPRIILVLSPLALGYGFMWAHHAFFPIFLHKQMVVLGLLLGGLNILIYEAWKRRANFKISIGKSDGK